MSLAACRPETLLSTTTCDIQYCADCKMIHLMMGSITLRIPEEHFQELAQDMGRGLIKLKARDRSSFDFNAHNVTTLHS